MFDMSAWETWLSSPESARLLRAIAKKLHSDLCRQEYHPEAWRRLGLEPPVKPTGHDGAELDALAHVAWGLLRGLQQEAAAFFFQAAVLQPDPASVRRLLRGRLEHILSDFQRRKEVSPYHAFYRRARDVFKKEKGVQYVADKNSAWFSFSEESALDVVASLSGLVRDFKKWPMPYVPSPSELHQQEHVLALGRTFCAQVHAALGKDALVSIRDFAEWVFHYYEQPEIVNDSDMAPGKMDDELHETIEIRYASSERDAEGHEEMIPLPAELTRLENAVRSMVEAWNPKTVDAFWLTYGPILADAEPRTLEVVAARMDMKGKSHVRYYLEKAKLDIGTMQLDWDIPPGGLPVLLKFVLEICRERSSVRSWE